MKLHHFLGASRGVLIIIQWTLIILTFIGTINWPLPLIFIPALISWTFTGILRYKK